MSHVSRHDLSETSHGLFQAHKAYDPRVILFYFIIVLLLLVLAGGLAYQQLFRSDAHQERERYQNQRRIVVPGPRGDIKDREGRVLVGNRARFSVVLYLDELRREIRDEHILIHKNYLKAATEKTDVPSFSQTEKIARVSVVQRYLDEVDKILKRESTVDAPALYDHFSRKLSLPYTLLDDLSPDDYARLLERIPVTSPVQVYAASTRYYPYGPAAAHTLGYIGVNEEVVAEDFPDEKREKLRTFPMKGTIGREGLERRFDSQLQGEAGGAIIRVDPAGYRVNSSDLPHRLPTQGKELVTSLDIDLQQAAEAAIGEQVGAAVALDVKTGEVLVLASTPGYDLKDTSPRISADTWKSMQERDALNNKAISGSYPPGSTFKIVNSIAALRSGRVDPDQPIADCEGYVKIANAMFNCENGNAHHGELKLAGAISVSCDIYFYELGRLVTPELMAAEARRFGLDRRTGIELPGETSTMLIPDPAWKERARGEKWFPGDTAHMAIGQGFVLVTPLDMACFIASVARNETITKPTLLHNPNAPTQHTESIGLTPVQRAVLLQGMEGVTLPGGTASLLTTAAQYHLPVRIAGKTGTAQKRVKINDKIGTINYAWFICFAPLENPEIAIAVMLEGDTIGEAYGGGRFAAPVASTILKKYFEKKTRPPSAGINPFQSPP